MLHASTDKLFTKCIMSGYFCQHTSFESFARVYYIQQSMLRGRGSNFELGARIICTYKIFDKFFLGKNLLLKYEIPQPLSMLQLLHLLILWSKGKVKGDHPLPPSSPPKFFPWQRGDLFYFFTIFKTLTNVPAPEIKVLHASLFRSNAKIYMGLRRDYPNYIH